MIDANSTGGVVQHQLIRALDLGLDEYHYIGMGMAGPGDIDGDGVDDLVLYIADGTRETPMSLHVLFLQANGTARPNGLVKLQYRANNRDLLQSAAPKYFVSSPGDVDGDGVPDLMVPVTHHSQDNGFMLLLLGRDGQVRDGVLVSDNDRQLETSNFIEGAVSVGDLDGDGRFDVALSTSRNLYLVHQRLRPPSPSPSPSSSPTPSNTPSPSLSATPSATSSPGWHRTPRGPDGIHFNDTMNVLLANGNPFTYPHPLSFVHEGSL